MSEESILWFNPDLGTPMVSMAEYGLTFNRAAVEALRRPWKVRLGFDNAGKRIVVQPIRSEIDDSKLDSRGLPFAERERDGYVRISSKDFVRFVARYCKELDLSKTVRYAAIWDDEQGMLEIDLSRPVDGSAD